MRKSSRMAPKEKQTIEIEKLTETSYFRSIKQLPFIAGICESRTVLCGAAQASNFHRFPASGWQRILLFASSLRAAIYNPLQPQEITIDDLNARSFREQMKLGG